LPQAGKGERASSTGEINQKGKIAGRLEKGGAHPGIPSGGLIETEQNETDEIAQKGGGAVLARRRNKIKMEEGGVERGRM